MGTPNNFCYVVLRFASFQILAWKYSAVLFWFILPVAKDRSFFLIFVALIRALITLRRKVWSTEFLLALLLLCKRRLALGRARGEISRRNFVKSWCILRFQFPKKKRERKQRSKLCRCVEILSKPEKNRTERSR